MQPSTTLYRSILRDQLVDILKNIKLVEENRVFRNFPIRIPQDRLPCFFVSSPADRAEPLTTGPPVFRRKATLVIQYFCNFANIDDGTEQLDAICYQIEQAIFCDYDFQQKIELISSFDTDVVFNSDTGKQIAEIRFVMICHYREEFNPNGTIIDHILGQTT